MKQDRKVAALEMETRFRAEGKKVTPQRQRIFDLLAENTEHPTAENIFRMVQQDMPTVSLKTVYQTLNELGQLGMVNFLELGGGSMRFDPNVNHDHQHLVCEVCGSVADIDLGPLERVFNGRSDVVFLVTRAEVILRGVCEVCQKIDLDSANQQEVGSRQKVPSD